MRVRLILSCLVLVCGTVQAASLPPAEPWHARAHDMLEHLIDVPTVIGRDRVPEVAQWLADQYRTGGFPDRDIQIRPYDKTAALIVRWRAPGKPKAKPIMLMGHLDVVEARAEDWKAADPFRFTEKDGYYYG